MARRDRARAARSALLGGRAGCMLTVDGRGGGLRDRANAAVAAARCSPDERGRRLLVATLAAASAALATLSATLGSPQCSSTASLAARWSANTFDRPPAHSVTHRAISMCWDTAVSGCCGPGPWTRPKWVPGGDVRRVWAKSEVFPGFLTYFGPWLLVGFVRGANRLTLLSGRPPCVTDLPLTIAPCIP